MPFSGGTWNHDGRDHLTIKNQYRSRIKDKIRRMPEREKSVETPRFRAWATGQNVVLELKNSED